MDDNSTDMEMMKMFLHFGEREKILFSWWKTGSAAGLILSLVVVFMLCIFYEAIKGFRFFIAIQHERQKRDILRNRPASPSAEPRDNISEHSISFAPLLRLNGSTRNLFTAYRVVQALLYGVQAILAYVLMLIVMTFNVWLILAVVIGEAVGYFLFTGTPLIDEGLGACC
ncbi:unnamed protein product, partial [Mesorhabditis belari]|uniref:Copper transport protein n=1 Tax=Mesorhabditis belari TaxID=2138241 RepID=A0AAF3EUA6_9BILA